MTKKNEILKLDFQSLISITESIVDNDPECQEALEKQRKLFDNLKKNYSIDIALEVDNAATFLETVIREAVYKKAFQDGMCFILNAMAGKEVIEI